MNILATLKNRYYVIVALLLFLLSFTVYYLTGEGEATPYNYFAPLAEAFLDGRLYLLDKPSELNELLRILPRRRQDKTLDGEIEFEERKKTMLCLMVLSCIWRLLT